MILQAGGIGLLLQAFTALLVFLLGAVTTAIGWYMKTHVITEVNKNSEFRRYATGTTYEQDDGALQELHALIRELEDLSKRIESQHDEMSAKVDYVIKYTNRIADGVETDIEEPDRRWEVKNDD